jgi:putative nuclease YbcO-like protein
MNLRKLAKGQNCKIRLPGVCNHNPETVVLAHFRLPGISGLGFKPPDLLGSWACSSCHAWVDSHSDENTQLAFAHGVMRTINALIEDGAIKA